MDENEKRYEETEEIEETENEETENEGTGCGCGIAMLIGGAVFGALTATGGIAAVKKLREKSRLKKQAVMVDKIKAKHPGCEVSIDPDTHAVIVTPLGEQPTAEKKEEEAPKT